VNFNIDLMYGLPQQDIAGALADIDAALALEPAHLSHYELTLEPGTVFGAQPPPLPDDDTVDGALRACQQRLAQAGFLQYEVSAYARTGRRCRHNLNYWQFGDYLGIGAGAHGKLSHRIAAPRASLRITRTSQWREPRRYLAAAGQELACTPVQRAELPFEFMMNALRLLDGFSEALYERRTGEPFAASAGSTAALAQERGWLERRGARWRATEKGLRFLNELLLEFMHREGNAASNETFTKLSGESTQPMATNPLK
jgi:oxygen-independent coproporphyrinogen-3 oxidase